MGDLAKYLKQQYIEWFTRINTETGAYPSQAEFARCLGIDTQTFNHYLMAERMPRGENLDKLAVRLGPEVYELARVTSIVTTDPLLCRLVQGWDGLLPEQKEQIGTLICAFLGEGDDG